jgi:hypothetical protein
MITDWPFIYVYPTNRDDFPYAVGMMPEHGPANGGIALVADKGHAVLLANALQTQIGGTVEKGLD